MRWKQRVAASASWQRVNDLWMYTCSWTDAGSERRPPLVLVHGLGVSHRYLIPLAGILAERFDVYVPDFPGFGRSEKPSYTLSVMELAELLDRWMQAVQLERALLLGNSLGCQIIADLAVLNPERVARAVFIGPTVDCGKRSLLAHVLSGLRDVPHEDLSLWPLLLQDYLRAGVRRFVRTFHAMLADPIEERAPFVQAPTMIIRAAHDPMVSQEWVERLTALLPMGRLVVLPKGGHGVHYSYPQSVADAAAPFLCAAVELEREVAGSL